MSSYSNLRHQHEATCAELAKANEEIAQLNEHLRECHALLDKKNAYADFANQLWQTLHILGVDIVPPLPIKRSDLVQSDELTTRERAIALNELLAPRVARTRAKRKIV